MNPETDAWELSFYPSQHMGSRERVRVVLVDDEQPTALQVATEVDGQCDCDCDC